MFSYNTVSLACSFLMHFVRFKLQNGQDPSLLRSSLCRCNIGSRLMARFCPSMLLTIVGNLADL